MLPVATGIPVVAAEEIDLRTVDRRLRPSRCFVQLTLASARIPSSFVTWIFTNPKQLIIKDAHRNDRIHLRDGESGRIIKATN